MLANDSNESDSYTYRYVDKICLVLPVNTFPFLRFGVIAAHKDL